MTLILFFCNATYFFIGHHFLPADDVVNAQGQPAAHHQAAVFETGKDVIGVQAYL